MSIGKTIRKMREIRQLKQEDMAEKLNMSLTGYGKIERDEVQVNMERLEEIARIFEVGAVDILHEKNEQKGASFIQNNHAPNNNNGIFYYSEKERELYDKLLVEKHKRIEALEKMLSFYEQRTTFTS